MINRSIFYMRTDQYFGAATDEQKDGYEAILSAYEKRGNADMRPLAFYLGTTRWETSRTMQPVRETAYPGYSPTDEQVRETLANVWYAQPDPRTGHSYYGRGLVQCTFEDNYAKVNALLHLLGVLKPDESLVDNPDLMLRMDVAIATMFEGCERGLFTGAKLGHFFTSSASLWVASRTIINGNDHASDIADLEQQFWHALGGAMFYRLLRMGCKGDDVELVQHVLKDAKLYNGPIDGDFGPGTRAAVFTYQSRMGLDVDGVVGNATRIKMNIAYS